MKFSIFLSLACAALIVKCASVQSRQETSDSVEAISSFEPVDVIGELASEGLEQLMQLENISSVKSRALTCSLNNVVIRQDWDHLSAKNRIAYTDAVLCLMAKPSRLNSTLYVGAKTRYDDFVAVHINYTLTIHSTGNFLGWHRYFVYLYETALRDECGYKGYQPYWNWGTHAANEYLSPVFDGSATSLSGNGAFLAHNGSLAGAGTIFLPSGSGGGCVTSGPFKNMTVNLGPVSPTQRGVVKGPSMFSYIPRCLRRDITPLPSVMALKNSDIASLIVDSPDIATFQNTMQGNFPEGILGVHAAGHFIMNGDPGGDLFVSPGDPVFWLHHAMVDRTWWIWQLKNLPTSLATVAGTLTLANNPPSANATLADLQSWGPLSAQVQLGKLLNTLSGPFCYIYL